MKRISVCLTALLALIPLAHSGDTTQFKVDLYVPEKFVDLEWRLDGNVRLEGWDNEPRYSSQSGDLSRTNRQGNLSSRITYRRYTIPEFLNLSIGLSGSFWYERIREYNIWPSGQYSLKVDHKRVEHRSYLTATPAVEYGKYIVSDAFFGIVGEGSFSWNEWRRHSDRRTEQYDGGSVIARYGNSYRESGGNTQVHASGGFIAGWGRVYAGKYAVTVMELIRELKRSGVLLREPTAEEYRLLSDSVYLYRERHAFDKRDNRIAAITAIANQLEILNVTTSGVLPVMLISDIWEYYPRDTRQFGWRAYGGPVGIWDWTRLSRYPQGSYFPMERSNGSWGFRAALEYFRPLSLRWQVNGYADYVVVFDDWRFRRTDNHYDEYYLAADAGYFFDSRTSGFARFGLRKEPSPLDMLPYKRPSMYYGFGTPNDANSSYRTTEVSISLRHRLSRTSTASIEMEKYWNDVESASSAVVQKMSRYQIFLGVTHWLY